jgi:hypothetical protein
MSGHPTDTKMDTNRVKPSYEKSCKIGLNCDGIVINLLTSN